MKELKSVGLFFIMGAAVFLVGFLGGLGFSVRMHRLSERNMDFAQLDQQPERKAEMQSVVPKWQENTVGTMEKEEDSREIADGEQASTAMFEGFLDVASLSGVLGADTEYVLEETDVLRGATVETTLKLPKKYIGMDRERFTKAMETYAASPPLSELERGFVGLEVKSFSRQRVVVQMNYRYVQPGESFYLALMDHKIVVFLEDQKTIYITTGITIQMLPEDLQEQLNAGMIFVQDESSLYDFLETYSS